MTIAHPQTEVHVSLDFLSLDKAMLIGGLTLEPGGPEAAMASAPCLYLFMDGIAK